MSRLADLLQKLCPNGVEYLPLSSMATIQRGERITKKDLVECGAYPVISGGVLPMGRYSHKNREANTITISSYGAAGYIDFVKEDFWANDVCLSVLPKETVVDKKYLYYALLVQQNYIYANTTKAIPDHIPTQFLLDLSIPVPPLEVQREIVRILDNFTELTAELTEELTEELTARKNQYAYYRDQLLTFGEEGPMAKWIQERCPNGVEFKYASDVAEISIGEFVHKSKQSPSGKYPVFNGGTSNTGFYDEYNRTANKIIISARGANAGFVNRVFTNYWSGNSCYTVDVVDENMDWTFVYYWFKSKEQVLVGSQQKGGIPAVSKRQVENLMVPVPPLEVQARIVSILERFEALCSDLSAGLPAEIEARRRQYAYYRDQLLTFRRASV